MSLGEVEGAIAYYERALGIAREVNDRHSELELLNSLGAAGYYLEDAERAIGYYEKALSVAQKIEDRDEQAILLFNIGDARHLQDRLAEAEHKYKESLEFDHPITNYKCAAGLGMIYLQEDRLDDAISRFGQSTMLCELRLRENPRFHPEYAALVLAQLGMGEPELAMESLREGLNNGRPTVAGLHYAHQDLLVLQRVREDLPGLGEAIRLLERAMGA